MMVMRGPSHSVSCKSQHACNQKMSESESSGPLKEYLERTREVHSKVHSSLTGCLLSQKKIQIGNFVLILCSVTCCLVSGSMRSRMWKLRLSGIKSMAPLWHLIIPITKS